ncbi:10462_t:CDS:1, partial [Cetraspora pellucida]
LCYKNIGCNLWFDEVEFCSDEVDFCFDEVDFRSDEVDEIFLKELKTVDG